MPFELFLEYSNALSKFVNDNEHFIDELTRDFAKLIDNYDLIAEFSEKLINDVVEEVVEHAYVQVIKLDELSNIWWVYFSEFLVLLVNMTS